MPCQPLSSDAFVLPSGGPGFGGSLGAISLPDLTDLFPALPLENLQELFDAISMIVPPGIQKPAFHPDVLNDVYAGIRDVLAQFMPFLMLYKFFLPVLNLILCIIEVLCALMNPFKLIRALRRLFRNCIPEFLSLFPQFALIIMIISLLLLIIAIIEYIIQRIIMIIETILKNIIILTEAAQSLNNDSIIAITRKIGDLLCLLQNLFIVFALFNTIIEIIKIIAGLFFRIPPCDSSDGSDDGCCTPDVCPEFIKENETIASGTGTFVYQNAVGIDSGLALPVGFENFYSYLRQESWQFYDGYAPQETAFYNITHAYDLPSDNQDIIFWPGTNVYDGTQSFQAVPYYMDFELTYNPALFGRTSDTAGIRQIKIRKAIVTSPPTAGLKGWDNNFTSGNQGTLNLVGGNVTEMDGTPFLDEGGLPMTVRTFFHNPIRLGSTLSPFDPLVFSGASYTFYINHPVLVAANLITIGCVPSVAAERDFLNTVVGARFNNNGIAINNIIPLLPSPAAAQECLTTAITKYRQQISTETTNLFKDEVMACLQDLRDQTATALGETVSAGFDPYASTFTIEPSIQFTTGTVQVQVSLREHSGNSITNRLPADVAEALASKLTARNSFGEISAFTYDGTELFIANISSKEAGNGVISVAFDNNYIGVVTVPADLDTPQTVSITEETYTFVLALAIGDGAVLRDDTDVSGE